MKKSNNNTKAKNKKHSIKKLHLYIVLVAFLAAAAVLLLAMHAPKKIKEIYYKHKVESSMASESKKLGDPLKALGFTDVKTKSSCNYYPKAGYQGNPLSCVAEQQSYVVFGSSDSKNKVNTAAANLSTLLSHNDWKQREDLKVDKFFKGVTSKVDYYPDAYIYKYFDNTLCVLDFYEAYSNPKPPAASVVFTCSAPESHPPIYLEK
jgi:hypothetical protein